MPSTYSPNLKIELIQTGEQSGTWGATTDNNLTLIDKSFAWGYLNFPLDADNNTAGLISDGLPSAGRGTMLWITSSVALTAIRTMYLSPVSRTYMIANKTAGGQTIYVRIGANGPVAIGADQVRLLSTDGANFVDGITTVGSGLTIEGQLSLGSICHPAAITDWVYEWNPSGFTTATTVMVTNTNANTGIVSLSGARHGRIVALHNVGGVQVHLYDEHPGVTAVNRFYFGYPGTTQILQPMESIILISYDRWRALSRFMTMVDGGTF